MHFVAIAFVGVASIPWPARAETLLIPWVSANTSSPYTSGIVGFGGSVGVTAGGVIGVDVDFGYSPEFFGNNLNSYVLTTMGNVIVGIPFDRAHAAGIRPYVTGGVGLIRAHIDSARNNYSIASNDVGVNVGGGVMGFVGDHIGVRADLRYIRSVQDNNTTYPFSPLDLSRLHYWRTSFGLVVR